MPDLLVRSFTPLLLAFRPCFTQPGFSSFFALTCAWILCSGRRSLTRVIQSAQLGRFKHYCAFHRFFSQALWNLDALGHCGAPAIPWRSKMFWAVEVPMRLRRKAAAPSTSSCAQNLPAARKVQLTSSICDSWETQTIGRLPPRTYCTHETSYRRNAFADKDMLDLRQEIGGKLTPYIAGLMKSETIPNVRPMGENLYRALKPAGLLMSSQIVGSTDMFQLLQHNACDSVGLRTFDQNLKRFGTYWFSKLEPFEN